MLPLKADARHFAEVEGVRYGFKYLIGSTQEKFSDMMNESAKALRSLDRIGKKLKNIDENDVRSIESLYDALEEQNRILRRHRIALVEMFLDSIGGEPVCGPLSDYFVPGAIDRLAEIVQVQLPILSGNEVREIKNSSRPHSSDSTGTDSSTGANGATVEQKSEEVAGGRQAGEDTQPGCGPSKGAIGAEEKTKNA